MSDRMQRLVIDHFKAEPGQLEDAYLYCFGPGAPNVGLAVKVDDKTWVHVDDESAPLEDYAPCLISKEPLTHDQAFEIWSKQFGDEQ